MMALMSARQAVVLLASWFSHVLIAGVHWGGSGALFAAMRGQFTEGSGTLAMVFTFSCAMTYLVGPISSLLTNRYGHRTVAMVGGTLCAVGVSISCFAENIYHLHIAFGFITGVGMGLAYIPSVSIVALHFKETRTIALGFAVSGVGVGTFVFPPLMRLFIHHYSWRGAFLLTGALCLHIVACGALYKPLQKKRTAAESKDDVTELHEKKYETVTRKLKQKEHVSLWIKHCHFHIFKSKSFIFLCFNNLFFLFGLSIIYVHLAAYAHSLGFSADQGAYLFCAIGVANFIGRIAFGFLAHIPCFSAVSLYTVTSFLTGAVTEITSLFTTYAALVGFAVAFGFLSASLGTLLPQLVVDILGVDLMTSGFGYLLIFEAVGMFAGAPVAGWLCDNTMIYTTCLYLGGAVIIFSSLLMIYPWYCCRRDRRHLTSSVTNIVAASD